jgi:dipeptidyl aminopeptidase/acylaminoacyl peptidase
VLIHGTEDRDVPYEMSVRYRDAALRRGDSTRLIAFDGGHFEPVDPASEVWADVVDAVSSLLSDRHEIP